MIYFYLKGSRSVTDSNSKPSHQLLLSYTKLNGHSTSPLPLLHPLYRFPSLLVLPVLSLSPDLLHQQNVKTTRGPPSGVMVPLVLLVPLDPPRSTFSVKLAKVWIRTDQSGPGGPRGPNPPWWTRSVQDHLGPCFDIFLMF